MAASLTPRGMNTPWLRFPSTASKHLLLAHRPEPISAPSSERKHPHATDFVPKRISLFAAWRPLMRAVHMTSIGLAALCVAALGFGCSSGNGPNETPSGAPAETATADNYSHPLDVAASAATTRDLGVVTWQLRTPVKGKVS